MTWLSRLLPPTSRVKDRAARHNRTTKQRRRTMTVENLEHRIVLSNVSTSLVGSTLTINADRFNNNFRIVEATASGADHGKVTVESGAFSTTINGTLAPYQTPVAVTAIKINFVGTTDSDVLEIVGAGKNATTTVKTITISVDKTYLNLNVHDVANSGAFSLTTKGKLDASLVDSTFSAVTIDQSQGCCVAHVELGNVTASGAVTISEGKWNGTEANHNSVDIHDSKLGSTTITQLDGDWNSVEVAGSTVKDLSVRQGDGDHDSIDVHGLRIASSSFGVKTVQGDGDNDSTTIDDVGVTGLTTNRPVKVPDIYVTQGDGDADFASVTNVNVGGDVGICQGDGAGDQAYINNSYIGSMYQGTYYFGYATIVQGDGLRDTAAIDSVIANFIFITQGDGDEDSAFATNSVVFGAVGIVQGDGGDVVDPQSDGSDADPDLIGDVAVIDNITGSLWSLYIVQGCGDGDLATISNSDAQGLNPYGYPGGVYITQGDGDNDFATIESVLAANLDIFITQGDGDNDYASINAASALDGSIYIEQGCGDNDEASITNSDAYCDISIAQGDGDTDVATIDSSSTTWNNIWIAQGCGDNDSATISNSLSAWRISITQGDGVLDTASVLNSTALGYAEPAYDQAGNILYWIDYAGEISITQGDGYGDWAIVDGMYADYTATNVYICQGNNIVTPDCDGFPGDTVFVNNALIYSDLFITQGHEVEVEADEAGDDQAWGGYSVYIAAGVWDRDGNVLSDPADVLAGGYTDIYQHGGGNLVVMGSDSSSFYTVYLDVYTGDDGGAFVQATNVTVDWGSGYGNDFSIDGGGDQGDPDSLTTGNVYFDAGGNSGFTASDRFATVTL
jgi:hypothetical protein